MKPPDLYTDWRVVAGIVLLLLGAGNWIIGLGRAQYYAQVVASRQAGTTEYRSFDELDARAGAVLEPLTAEQRQLSYTRARIDFYHAAFLVGRAMVAAGVIVTFWGFVAVIQKDTRRAMRREALIRAMASGGPNRTT